MAHVARGVSKTISKAINSFDITEADEAATSLNSARCNLEYMACKYARGCETMGVLGMYELAAISAGISPSEADRIIHRSLDCYKENNELL
jgi:hypothetical protein